MGERQWFPSHLRFPALLKFYRTILVIAFAAAAFSPVNANEESFQALKGGAIWIDADTGNETDDLYALFRILIEPGVNIAGLSSAHFNNADLVAVEKWNQYPTSDIDTVGISQKLNESLLKAMDLPSIPHPLGADRAIGRAWGGTDARDSAAARGMIAAVGKLPTGGKLRVVCLGALTNIASALTLDGSIADHITIYLLGTRYDKATRIWNKNEFNIRNDLNAFDLLLDHPTLDLVVMSTNTVRGYQFKKSAMFAALSEAEPAEKMLQDRWEETNPEDQARILWDVALVQAVLRPELATLESAPTPPENTPRSIRAYTRIDVPAMTADLLGSFEDRP